MSFLRQEPAVVPSQVRGRDAVEAQVSAEAIPTRVRVAETFVGEAQPARRILDPSTESRAPEGR